MSNHGHATVRAIADIAIIAIVGVAVWLPIADATFNLDRALPLSEFRTLKTFPQPSRNWASLAAYPGHVSAYHDDHFGFRDSLVRAYGFVCVRALGISPNDEILLGRDGWLYYIGDDALEYHRVARPWDADIRDAWVVRLREREAWCARNGIRFYVLIAPNKHSIYPEFLPHAAQRIGQAAPLDDLTSLLGADFPLVDVRRVLAEGKQSGLVYYRTDSHWNGIGAFWAYRTLIERMGRDVPGLAPLRGGAIRFAVTPSNGLENARLMGMEHLYQELRYEAKPRTPRAKVDEAAWIAAMDLVGRAIVMSNTEAAQGTALIVHDSFGAALQPLLAEHFRRTVFVPENAPFEAIVERERPDFVVLEVVERHLMRLPPLG